jgi:hypothetical protein
MISKTPLPGNSGRKRIYMKAPTTVKAIKGFLKNNVIDSKPAKKTAAKSAKKSAKKVSKKVSKKSAPKKAAKKSAKRAAPKRQAKKA